MVAKRLGTEPSFFFRPSNSGRTFSGALASWTGGMRGMTTSPAKPRAGCPAVLRGCSGRLPDYSWTVRGLLRWTQDSPDAPRVDLLDQMRTFVRIAETGSLSRAARSLRLSLAAVSRQLSALERELGVPLVLRTTRRLSLTEAGRAYQAEAVRVLGAVERARETVRGSRRAEGRVVV